jgi:hypothetical protein
MHAKSLLMLALSEHDDRWRLPLLNLSMRNKLMAVNGLTARTCALESFCVGLYTKSSLMLGLGERDDEVADALHDLHDAGVDIVTLGQYLQPTAAHLPVEAQLSPEAFERWRRYGEDVVGFKFVAAGPLVRSSYRAGEFFDREMAGAAAKAAAGVTPAQLALS